MKGDDQYFATFTTLEDATLPIPWPYQLRLQFLKSVLCTTSATLWSEFTIGNHKGGDSKGTLPLSIIFDNDDTEAKVWANSLYKCTHKF
jgi:hypothetical protein